MICRFLRRGKTGVPGGKPLRAEKRTNKLNTRVASSLGIEPGPHWWEASALTTTPPLLPFIFYFEIRVLCSIRFSITSLSTLTLESEVLKEEEEKEGQSVSEEEEIKLSLEDETMEPIEEEEEVGVVVLTSEGESDMVSEDENEFLGDFSGTNCESIVLYR